MANRQEWAEWAVSGILLPKERESARQELLSWRYFHMPLYTPVTATITIFDQNGGLLAEKTIKYS